MTTYKWTLRKGSRKDVCPQCGKKRFVPYVLTADPSVKAGPEYGRCDREQSCGYFRSPGGEVAVESTREYKPEPKKEPMLYHTNLLHFAVGVIPSNTLYAAYEPLLGKTPLWMAMSQYKCGTGSMGECIYYQYDGTFVRTAKAIRYGADGHRLKGDDGNALPVWWLHKSRGFEIPEDRELKQCLFGQHLLLEHPDRDVTVVEAEKTAVLMAAYDRYCGVSDRVIVACGGSQMLKGAVDLMPLMGRRVTLIPDHGQYWNWYRTAKAYGWDCTDITMLDTEGLPDGYDMWDIYEREIKKQKSQ